MPSEQRIRELASAIDIAVSTRTLDHYERTALIESAIRAALAEQREEDAKLCDAIAGVYREVEKLSAQHCANSIRAQGK